MKQKTLQSNLKNFANLLGMLILLFSTLGSFTPAAAQEGNPVIEAPLFPGLTWGEPAALAGDIQIQEELASVPGTEYIAQEQVNIEQEDALLEYYASPNLEQMGWKQVSIANSETGVSTLYFHEKGFFLKVEFSACAEDASLACIKVWVSERTELKPVSDPNTPAPAATGTITKKSPANGTSNLSTSGIVISWNAYSGTNLNRYRYCIDNTNDNDCDAAVGWTNAWSNLSATLPTLSASKTYYWQVQAVLNDNTKVSADSGVYWAFSTLNFAAFGKISPVNNVTGLQPTVTLSWQTNPNAVTGGYRYCISESTLNCTNWVATTNTSVTLALSPKKTYKWQVRAYDGAGGTGNSVDADGGTWWVFSTVNMASFNKTAPVSNAANQPLVTTLSWAANSEATGGYKYCISENGVACINWLSTTSTSVQVVLSPKKTYIWQVRAYKSDGTTYIEANNGAWWLFSTINIQAFGKTAPVNGAVSRPLNLSLSWQANPDATAGYQYCITKLNTACTTWVSTAATSVNVALELKTSYMWQVRAVNTQGYSLEADTNTWWVFTTINAKAKPDFNGDGAVDFAVFRSADNSWNIQGLGSFVYAVAGDILVPGDYDGNGTSDIAVYRPSTGQWFVRGQGNIATWGIAGDVPVQGDYNGDGKTDVAVYRPSNGVWYVRGMGAIATYGIAGDIPIPADYTGDGRTDAAVFRPSNSTWYLRGIGAVPSFGTSGDYLVPGDFNGDGKAEIAVYTPSTGNWYIQGQGIAATYGVAGDFPTQADYNGDGKIDIAVFRPSDGKWYVRGMGVMATYGTTGDIPVTNFQAIVP